MKVVIIGCGLIGRKRALALPKEDELAACCDTNKEIADKFASDFACRPFTDYKDLLNKVQCDIAIVAVVNKFALNIVLDFLKSGKHVLAEKPLGRNVKEAGEMVNMSKQKGLVLKTGFNHRFHPALWKAKELYDKGEIGEIFNIRVRYGHGGRSGMEKEWRASKDLCGGGELLDQGVHVIDLIRWFGGEITEVYGQVETKFWPLEVEDNAFAIMKTKSGVSASFHVSWTNWKNIFSFEIFGKNGYLRIEGLGGSYGPETLEFGIRKPEGGKPDITSFAFDSEDISWKNEWKEFKASINERRQPIDNGIDGLRANEVIEALYTSSKFKKAINLG
jgi:predicted dehydrogenase